MNTYQIAAEAALRICGSSHGTGDLDRPTAIIKAAIEKAIDAYEAELHRIERKNDRAHRNE